MAVVSTRLLPAIVSSPTDGSLRAGVTLASSSSPSQRLTSKSSSAIAAAATVRAAAC